MLLRFLRKILNLEFHTQNSSGMQAEERTFSDSKYLKSLSFYIENYSMNPMNSKLLYDVPL